MPITIFKGLPGSGKSKRLIESIIEARSAGRATATIVSSDAEWIVGYESYVKQRRLGCRAPGISCPIDHFIPTAMLAGVLESVDTGSLVAIDEAQMFGASAVRDWLEASRRGVELIVVSPSPDQLSQLTDHNYSEVTFIMQCQMCQSRDASTVLMELDDTTVSVCMPCFSEAAEAGKSRAVELLIDELPHRGEKKMYQPIELPECEDWPVSRPDSQARADIVVDTLRKLDLLESNGSSHRTYLDIGCSTGFFCNSLQQLGFFSKGVDAVQNNIAIAKLLDSFVRRSQRPNKKFVTYIAADAYEYLRTTPQERFDVVSAYSVIQWVMTQRPLDEAMMCFDWLFAKATSVCVLEMGYSSQDQYAELLPITVDRQWVLDLIGERGHFDEVLLLDAEEHGIMRDLFIGLRGLDSSGLKQPQSGPKRAGRKRSGDGR